MRLHRFYIEPGTITLEHSFWLHDPHLLQQWSKVLRYQAGQQVVLFDGVDSERLYKITEIKPNEAHLELVTDFERQLPANNVYLLWSLLKKDKNDWVLQKATELGVSHFVPLLAERSEKTGFDVERAHKIVVEAAEQCGRSDIPSVREPMLVKTAIDQLGGKMRLFVGEQTAAEPASNYALPDPVGVLIGPEGGWTDAEKTLFVEKQLSHMGLGAFTLRAETAAVVAAQALHQLK